VLGEKTAVDVGKLLHNAGYVRRAQREVHHVERLIQILREVGAVGLGEPLYATGEEVLFEDARILSEEAEE
jgi:hypothetical protein